MVGKEAVQVQLEQSSSNGGGSCFLSITFVSGLCLPLGFWFKSSSFSFFSSIHFWFSMCFFFRLCMSSCLGHIHPCFSYVLCIITLDQLLVFFCFAIWILAVVGKFLSSFLPCFFSLQLDSVRHVVDFPREPRRFRSFCSFLL